MEDSNSLKLKSAIAKIGKNKKLRNELVKLCKKIELNLSGSECNIREEVTGPIIDALHQEAGILNKKLKSGVLFDFYYKSRIARDFVLSLPEITDHVWEPQTTKLLLLLSKDAKNVLIGGAYFGDHAILISHQIKQQRGVCHAFEPDAEPFQMLVHNAEINGLDNLKAHQKFLWNSVGASLQLVGDDALARSEEQHSGSSISSTTVDYYLSEQKIRNIDLLMLDIEGGEWQALQGAQHQLGLPADQAPKVVFEVHSHYIDWSRGLHNTDIVKFLNSKGYTVFAIRDFHSNFDMNGKPVELIPPESVYLEGPPHGFNMLATKQLSVIQNNHFKICHGVSPKLLLHKNPKFHHPMDGL